MTSESRQRRVLQGCFLAVATLWVFALTACGNEPLAPTHPTGFDITKCHEYVILQYSGGGVVIRTDTVVTVVPCKYTH